MAENKYITRGIIDANQELEVLDENEKFGRYEFKPYARGFGHTIGNALRRIMLSSIIGAAVERIRIKGVTHEFTPIPNVREDAVDVILNIKKLSLDIKKGDKGLITIKESGKNRVITSADIQTDGNVEVKDKEIYICTLDDGELEINMEVGLSRGYKDALDNITDDMPEGVIPVDSMYSPVRRVNYIVEDVRVGHDTNHDSIVFEIWTDGSVTPRDALAHSAKILKDHLNKFINFEEEIEEEEEGLSPEEARLKEILIIPISELELSVRSKNCLDEIEIKAIGELAMFTEEELLKTKNFGRKSLNEIKEKLSKHGLTLGMSNISYLLDESLSELNAKNSSDSEDEKKDSSQDSTDNETLPSGEKKTDENTDKNEDAE